MKYLEDTKEELINIINSTTPIEIEIGCGKGRFAIHHAQNNPDIHIIALDILWRFMKVGEYRASRRNLKNIQFIKVDAMTFLEEVVPDNSISRFHIYFPDPWNKRRHFKRRLINEEFLHYIHKKTTKSGSLHIATDHEGYAAQIKSALEATTPIWTPSTTNFQRNSENDSHKTNYELKYEREGRELFYFDVVRI